MGRKIRVIIMAVLLVVFCVAGGIVFSTYHRYEQEDEVYESAAEEFTHRIDVAEKGDSSNSGLPDGSDRESGAGAQDTASADEVPLEVDFEKLLEINSDIEGWLYCADTKIDYPVVQGEDDSFYLSHNYKRGYQQSGSLFIEVLNRPGFADSNTIIYGHQMNNGSMFGSLASWKKQEFYEEHPVMWLLTPEKTYKILLFSGYTTSALSDTYTVFTGPCSQLEEYLQQCAEASDFKADVELDVNAKYVTFSTCAYDFENARYVLHGKLVPVEE